MYRFFVDGLEVAVFADITDDGGDSDWVTGVTLSDGAKVRVVPAKGVELQQACCADIAEWSLRPNAHNEFSEDEE